MATVANLGAVAAAILTAIRTIDGTGHYNNSLTDYPNDRVQAGVPDSLPLLPAVYLQEIRATSTINNVPLGHHERGAQFTLVGYAVGDGTKLDRIRDALNLLSDVDRSLMADRTLGGLVLDVYLADFTVIDGLQESDALPYGVCGCVYEVRWRATTAGGI